MAGPIPLPDLTLELATTQGPFRSDSVFNSSGWTVATSGSKTGQALPDWVLYAFVGLALVYVLKRKKG